jgi:hypothetical protein
VGRNIHGQGAQQQDQVRDSELFCLHVAAMYESSQHIMHIALTRRRVASQ